MGLNHVSIPLEATAHAGFRGLSTGLSFLNDRIASKHILSKGITEGISGVIPTVRIENLFNNQLDSREVIREVTKVGDKVLIHPYYMDFLRFRENVVIQSHYFFNLKISPRSRSRYMRLFREFLKYCKAKRITIRGEHDYLNAVLMTVANLNLLKEGTWLSYSRDNNHYSKSSWNPLGISLHKLKSVITFLEDSGYVISLPAICYKDFIEFEYYSPIMTVTAKFLDGFNDCPVPSKDREEVIILKDKDKNRIELGSTGLATDVDYERVTVRAYNNLLSEHKFDIDGVVFENFYQRIYNNSRLDEGGRYYSEVCRFRNKGPDDVHGFESSYRRFRVKIDDEPVVEVDFKALHPCILMAIRGKSLTKDPYVVSDECDRAVTKIAMNIALNCSSRSSALRTIKSKFPDVDAEKILNNLESNNLEILGDLYSGCGIHLQYLESKIATGVILRFIKQDKPVITIHDSFICKRSDLEFLKRAMLDSFLDVVGEGINIVGVDWEWLDGQEIHCSGTKYLARKMPEESFDGDYEIIG